mgnify:CR=1 FL=1
MGLKRDYDYITFPSQENNLEYVPERWEYHNGAVAAGILSLGITHVTGVDKYRAEREYWKWPEKEHVAHMTRKGKIIRDVKVETNKGKGRGYVYDKGTEYVQIKMIEYDG